MTSLDKIDIRFTNDYSEACELRDLGYEPIECAFGQYGSVMGRYNMDHHGLESHREGVALRACRDLYGACRDDLRFVVTGTPDADAVLAIIALGALVEHETISAPFYTLVNAYDTDPIGINLLATPTGTRLAWFNQISNIGQSESGFRKAINAMVELLEGGLSVAEADRISKADRGRRRKALDGILLRLDADGHELPIPNKLEGSPVLRGQTALNESPRVLVVNSTVWGFDMWYRAAPVVVSFASRIQKVTVGCPDLTTAQALFGPTGLSVIWKSLGPGWGGRETIGGSPRGQVKKLADAHSTARKIIEHLGL
jgi:hypothetical protein